VEEYFELIAVLLARVRESQREKVKEASEMIADSVAEGRILHFFAPGHSHMCGRGVVSTGRADSHRVNVILEPALMVNYGAGEELQDGAPSGAGENRIFDESSASLLAM